MSAASELLRERPLEDISLLDVSQRAGIPVGSAYHFYPNINAVFAALTLAFGEHLATVLAQPYVGAETATWQTVLETAIDRATRLYAERPDYRQLILGGKAPTELKLSDRAHDEALGQVLIDAINQHFVLPEWLRRAEIFFFAVEIADLFFMLSQIRHGEITDEMCTECKRAAISYLRTYLPEHLPRRTDPVTDAAAHGAARSDGSVR